MSSEGRGSASSTRLDWLLMSSSLPSAFERDSRKTELTGRRYIYISVSSLLIWFRFSSYPSPMLFIRKSRSELTFSSPSFRFTSLCSSFRHPPPPHPRLRNPRRPLWSHRPFLQPFLPSFHLAALLPSVRTSAFHRWTGSQGRLVPPSPGLQCWVLHQLSDAGWSEGCEFSRVWGDLARKERKEGGKRMLSSP